jgi:hypothetical protein
MMGNQYSPKFNKKWSKYKYYTNCDEILYGNMSHVKGASCDEW